MTTAYQLRLGRLPLAAQAFISSPAGRDADDVRQNFALHPERNIMSARRARVSLCMTVRDEEQTPKECLEPVAELFDEIIIVDTGSRDGPQRIARQFTQHVFDCAW